MITDVEMQAMEMLVNQFTNRAGFEREHYALVAMNEMLADLDTDWFYSASEEDRQAFIKQHSDTIVSEKNRVAGNNEQTTWICVYKDTLCRHNDEDNLVEIEVPTAWLVKQLKDQGETDIKTWFEEYTADATDDIAYNALSTGVILDCNDEYVKKVFGFQRDYPDLVKASDGVKLWLDNLRGEVPDELGFEFDGVKISDPFYDENRINEVDPFMYYGVDNMKIYLEQAKDFTTKSQVKTLDSIIQSYPSYEEKLEALKTQLFMAGAEAIEDFLSFDIDSYSKDSLDNLIDQVADQMPEEEFEKYCQQYLDDPNKKRSLTSQIQSASTRASESTPTSGVKVKEQGPIL